MVKVRRDIYDEVFLGKSFAVMRVFIQFRRSSVGFGVTWFDATISKFDYGDGTVQELREDLKRFEFPSNSYWELLKKTIDELLVNYGKLPKDFIDWNLRGQVCHYYQAELDYLSQRIGIAEFATLVPFVNEEYVSKQLNSNLDFPIPVQQLGGENLWTIGQAKEFRRIQKLKTEAPAAIMNEEIGEYITMGPFAKVENAALLQEVFWTFDWTVDERQLIEQYFKNKLGLTTGFYKP